MIKKILILAANPRKDLNLDHEIRDLKRVIERSQNGKQFEVIVELSVQVEYLQDFLLQHQPQIVHFCGHGSGEQGLVFETEKGEEKWVRADALSDLFRLFEENIECVLLNACYSENQANAIINHINYVIGMNQEIRDDAAIAFSKGFYRALGYDCGIERAFEFGCNAINLEISGSSTKRSISTTERKAIPEDIVGINILQEHLKPVLKIKPSLTRQPKSGISAEKEILIQQEIERDLKSVKTYRQRDALIVGINQYDSENLPDLNSPAKDAKAIANVLETDGYGNFNVWRFPETLDKETTPLKTENLGESKSKTTDLSLNDLEQELVKLFMPDSGQQIPDTALFYFSGHIIKKSLGRLSEGFLVTRDAKPEAGFYGLSLQWLRRLLAQSPVKEQIIWLDCCHSGEWELTNFNEANSGGKGEGEGEAKSYFFLAFSRKFEASQPYSDSQQSVLTQGLLESFNPDHYSEEWITNYSITDYLKQHFNANQCTIFTNAGDAIRLIRKNIDVDSETENNGNNEQNFCPYKGLEFFTINDADYFYGREKLTDQLLNHIREHNFMAIVGASGSGKSSVLRAGLLYELQQGKKLSGSANWEVKVIIPTDNPFASLKLAFLDSHGDDIARAKKLSDLDELFQKGAEGFSNLISSITSQKERFILVIDQFEEIFTLCQDVPLREQFLELILTAVKQSSDKFTLIIAMRADFLLKCLEKEYSGLNRLIDANQISVTPMSEDELRKAITKPAEKAKLQLELGLVDEILKDVQQSSATLALVEDTLTELWKQRQGNSLQLSTYSKLGGITGTLDKRATKFYNDLATNPINPQNQIPPTPQSPNSPISQIGQLQQEAVRHIFLCLTQLGEGTEDTRRRVVKSSLYNKKFTSDLLEPVLQRLADERLIITDTRTSDPPKSPLESGTSPKIDPPKSSLESGISPKIDSSKSPLESGTSKIPSFLSSTKGNRIFPPFLRGARGDQIPFLSGTKGDQTPSPSGTRGDENQNQVIIDVPHEALIRNWKLLREWLRESRERLRQQRQWENLAQEWQQNPKSDYLLTGRRLRDGVEFRDKHEAEYPLNDETKTFIQQSLKQRNRNRFKSLGLFAIIPLIGTGIVGYFGYKEYQIQSHLNLLQNCPKPTGNEKEGDYINCEGRIEALEALAEAKRLPNLSNADLNFAYLESANLNSANLISAKLNFAYLESANLNSANLGDAHLNNANLYKAHLNNADLTEAHLESADLIADFRQAILISADLESAILRSADLTNAHLNYAHLNSADLTNAILNYAHLNYADLTNAILNYAHLSDADLSDANLTNAHLNYAENLTNQQIKSACNWDKAFYAKTWDDAKQDWVVDEKKQQAKLKELREDVASNPKEKPDCSKWESP